MMDPTKLTIKHLQDQIKGQLTSLHCCIHSFIHPHKIESITMSRSQAFRFCFCFKRMFKLSTAEPPKDVKELFDKYSENGAMSVDQLRDFMVECQGESEATLEDSQAIFNSLKHLNLFQRRGLHLDAFFRYLLGDLNLPLPTMVHQDMDAPLAHYFLYTGHNSYLTGNQLSSDSSITPIQLALSRGVRVIELDLWPGSNKDGIDVRHGGTLTSSVDLYQCLSAIKEDAFVASEYPVIITFEDHLTPRLRAIVAEMVKDVFGDMLHCPNPMQEEVLIPNNLKNKILISTKHPKESEEKEEGVQTIKDYPSRDRNAESDEDEDEEKTNVEYKNLIAIRAGKKKGSMTKTLASDFGMFRRLSLSEPQLEGAIKEHASAIVKFTQTNLLRVFPKGTRIASSNFNPITGWTHGAQMVAVNMQGYDKYLWITHGMFRANGGCGYVKKPDCLLQVYPNGDVFDPKAWRPVKTILKVKVYMGDGWHLDFSRTHFDPFSPPDFFTKVQIFGVPADKAKAQTRPIEDEWTPVWNQEFEFPLTVPELALLRVQVREFDTDRRHAFGGQTCLPVWELKSGIRAIPLYDKRGDKYKSVKLLMRFQFDNEN